MPFLNSEIWPNFKYTTETLCQCKSSETAELKFCRCAYSQIIMIQFFLGVMSLLNVEIWPKLIILLKQFVSPNPLKTLNGIS